MCRTTSIAVHWILAVAVLLTSAWLTSASAQEPLVNAGCEAPLVDGQIPGWQVVVGDGWAPRTKDPPPDASLGGLAYFAPGTAAEAELRQDVVAWDGRTDAYLGFQYRTGVESPSDVVRVVCEFREVEGGPVVATFDSGELTSPNGWSWYYVSDRIVYWPRFVRVRLLAERRSGATTDAWFDNLSLWVGWVDPVTPTTWSGVKALYR